MDIPAIIAFLERIITPCVPLFVAVAIGYFIAEARGLIVSGRENSKLQKSFDELWRYHLDVMDKAKELKRIQET